MSKHFIDTILVRNDTFTYKYLVHILARIGETWITDEIQNFWAWADKFRCIWWPSINHVVLVGEGGAPKTIYYIDPTEIKKTTQERGSKITDFEKT